jgi:PEP-CTERM motif
VNIKKGKMMKRTAKTNSKPGGVRKLCAALALGFVMGAAQANTVIDFEGLDSGFVSDSDQFVQQGLYLTAFSNVNVSSPSDLVGAIVDGSDLSMCFNLACPTNNKTTFYAGLNDGVLQLDPVAAGGAIHIYGLDASFIGAVAGASYPAVSGLLAVEGFNADGTSDLLRFNLAGPTAGSFNFQHFSTSAAFAAEGFAEVAIFGYVCDVSGNCKAFQTNQGQFALDNIDLGPAVSAVPEPGSWLMLALGLAGIAAAARRQRKNSRI